MGYAPCSKLDRRLLCLRRRCTLCPGAGSCLVFRSRLAVYMLQALGICRSFLQDTVLDEFTPFLKRNDLLLTRFGVRGPMPNEVDLP